MIGKKVALGAIAAMGLFAPLTIDTDGNGLFRLQEACGQASECHYKQNYICSTRHADHPNYECTAGCGE